MVDDVATSGSCRQVVSTSLLINKKKNFKKKTHHGLAVVAHDIVYRHGE